MLEELVAICSVEIVIVAGQTLSSGLIGLGQVRTESTPFLLILLLAVALLLNDVTTKPQPTPLLPSPPDPPPPPRAAPDVEQQVRQQDGGAVSRSGDVRVPAYL